MNPEGWPTDQPNAPTCECCSLVVSLAWLDEPHFTDAGPQCIKCSKSMSKVTVHVEVPDKANTQSITFEILTSSMDCELNEFPEIHEAIDEKLMEILEQPFGGWDLIEVSEILEGDSE